MSPIVHALMSWLIAITLLRELKDRRLAILAGVLPDIDGIFILFNYDLYLEYHRRVGHSFLFAIPLMLALGAFATNRKRTMAAGLLIFSVHLFADAMGSIDANWGVYPFYPLSNISFLGLPWFSDDFCYYTMGPIMGYGTFILILLLIFVKEATPLEFFSKKWDRRLVALYVYPFKYHCEECHKERAMVYCEVCDRKLCPEHGAGYLSTVCLRCGPGSGKHG